MTPKDKISTYYVMKIMIHLAWVPNSMVIFSASYEHILTHRGTHTNSNNQTRGKGKPQCHRPKRNREENRLLFYVNTNLIYQRQTHQKIIHVKINDVIAMPGHVSRGWSHTNFQLCILHIKYLFKISSTRDSFGWSVDFNFFSKFLYHYAYK